MTPKTPHPALHFSKARKKAVKVLGEDMPLWMAPNMDDLLNDFIEVSHSESGDLSEKNRCPFGAVLWPSARALWEWLCASEKNWDLAARPKDDAQVSSLELGAGVGFLSALLGANTQWSLTASDFEPAYKDYLEANCALLGSPQIPFVTLDWCENAPQDLESRFDLVIGCDVLYDDSHLKNIPRIAAQLLKPHGTLLLADPERFRFQTALSLLQNSFENVRIFSTVIDLSHEDVNSFGIANRNTQRTNVHIVHCQNPLTSTPY